MYQALSSKGVDFNEINQNLNEGIIQNYRLLHGITLINSVELFDELLSKGANIKEIDIYF